VQDGALGGVTQTERAQAMEAVKGHMLKESAQEFVRGQSHRLATVIRAVAVGEGDRAVIAGNDGLVAECGAMHIPAEIVEHGSGRGSARRARGRGPRTVGFGEAARSGVAHSASSGGA
jgi:hypothetical protein